MKLLVKTIVFRRFFHFEHFVLILIFSLSFTMLFGQDDKKAYINKATVYKEYSLFQQYHGALVRELEDSDSDNSKRVRELDSLYFESISKSAETSPVISSHERDKEMVNENQLDYVRDILSQYDENVAKCEANIVKVIEKIMKESGYTTWELIQSTDEKNDGVDITTDVLSRLNQK